MFDKELFLSLCKKYNVELSPTAKRPMIKLGENIEDIITDEIRSFLEPERTSFDYFNNKNDANICSDKYYLEEEFAIAC